MNKKIKISITDELMNELNLKRTDGIHVSIDETILIEKSKMVGCCDILEKTADGWYALIEEDICDMHPELLLPGVKLCPKIETTFEKMSGHVSRIKYLEVINENDTLTRPELFSSVDINQKPVTFTKEDFLVESETKDVLSWYGSNGLYNTIYQVWEPNASLCLYENGNEIADGLKFETCRYTHRGTIEIKNSGEICHKMVDLNPSQLKNMVLIIKYTDDKDDVVINLSNFIHEKPTFELAINDEKSKLHELFKQFGCIFGRIAVIGPIKKTALGLMYVRRGSEIVFTEFTDDHTIDIYFKPDVISQSEKFTFIVYDARISKECEINK